MLRYITFLLILISHMSVGQISFYRLFSNNGDDFGQGVVQLPDSSYVITGASSSFYPGETEAFLLKLDSLGNYVWSKHYGGAEMDWGRRVLHIPGDGFFICGYTNSYGNGGFDFYLIKTDENGNFQWDRTYGTSGWDRVHDAVLTADSGVVMVGEINEETDLGKQVYVVRTNYQGDTLWTRSFGGTGEDWATSIGRYQDSLYVVGGTSYIEDSSNYRGFLVQLNDLGQTMWSDTIGADGDHVLNDFIILDDLLQGVGYYQPDDSAGIEALRFNYDLSAPGLIALYNLYEAGDFALNAITHYGDSTRRYIGNGVVASFTEPGGQDYHIGRYDSNLGWLGNGVEVYNQGDDIGEQLIPTSDGGAMSVGYTTTGGSGGGNIYVLKIGPNDVFPNTVIGSSFDDLVGVESILKTDKIKVFPNPASHTLHIQTNHADQLSIRLVDLSGQTVVQEEITETSNVLNLEKIGNGMYSLFIYSDDQIIGLEKVVICQ